MFGFISSPCSRCGAAEFPIWRGAFCGLARCLGRVYGQPARLLVNRDAGFLALLGLSLDSSAPRWHAATCCNPFAAPFDVVDEHPAVLHAAAVSACGLAVKLDDDVEDEGRIRRALARAGRLISQPITDRAVARLNGSDFPTERVWNGMMRQESVERGAPLQADGPTAKAYGEITAHIAVLLNRGEAVLQSQLRDLGRALGALVYWRDARDDCEKDAAKGRFNPLHHTPVEAVQERVGEVWRSFCDSLTSLPLARHEELLAQVLLATQTRHSDFLGIEVASKMQRPGKRKRRSSASESGSSKKSSCWDSCCGGCDCPSCGRGGCADSCCDFGPGDSGCCDCCPCDGCDCCSC